MGWIMSVELGELISWDGVIWEVLNVGKSSIYIRNGEYIVELPYSFFESCIQRAVILPLQSHVSKVSNLQTTETLFDINADQYRVACERLQVIQSVMEGNRQPISNISPRTVRNWIFKYRQAESSCGNGIIGLLPRDHEKGNRTSKLSIESREFVDNWILRHYKEIKHRKIMQSYLDYQIECESKGIKTCSYKSFNKFIHASNNP